MLQYRKQSAEEMEKILDAHLLAGEPDLGARHRGQGRRPSFEEDDCRRVEALSAGGA